MIKEMEVNKIIQGDAFKELWKIPDNSIDLVLTDPPYNLEWKEEIKFKNRKNVFHHTAETEKWDDIDIVELYEKLAPEFNRVLKETGSVICFCRTEFITYLVDTCKKNDLAVKATIIWHKTNPVTQIRKKNYLSSIESIVWLARKRDEIPFTFNFSLQNEMHNFIEMPICGGNERTEHPTQKPLRLIQKLLQVHSNENDLVLDPFIGSGTTGMACKLLKRNFIGIEIDKKYCDIAEKRIKSISNPLF